MKNKKLSISYGILENELNYGLPFGEIYDLQRPFFIRIERKNGVGGGAGKQPSRHLLSFTQFSISRATLDRKLLYKIMKTEIYAHCSHN